MGPTETRGSDDKDLTLLSFLLSDAMSSYIFGILGKLFENLSLGVMENTYLVHYSWLLHINRL